MYQSLISRGVWNTARKSIWLALNRHLSSDMKGHPQSFVRKLTTSRANSQKSQPTRVATVSRQELGTLSFPHTGRVTIREGLHDTYETRVAARCSPRSRPDPVVWSSDPGPLSPAELQSYNRNGFLQLDNLLADSHINNLMSDLDRLLSDPATSSADPRCVIEKYSQEVRSVFEIHKTSAVAAGVILASSRMADMARQILGSDVYIHQSRINFKPAFVGRGFYWHSDFETWHAEDGMPAPRALSFSVNLTENTPANGPLMVIPGSHKTFVSCIGATPENYHLQSLREQEVGVPDRESLAGLVDGAGGRIETLTGVAGSAVMFDSNCVHGSSDNITPLGRCNLFVVFNSTHNTLREPYYTNKRRPEYIAARDFSPV